MRGRFLTRIGPMLAILCFVVAVLYPLVLLGRALYFGDLILYFYPLQNLIQHSLREGSIPLWNPWMLNGQPVVGNPQASVFYPSTLLLTLMPVWLFFTVNTFIHLALAGWGTYLYLRRITADRLSAILGAMVFAGSGFIVARLQFPSIVQTAAWLPWLLLVVDRIIERPSLVYGAALACVTALMILAGHAQVAYLSFACATAYVIARLIQIRRHKVRVRQAMLELTGFVVLGLLVASIQLLPMIQLFSLSTREHLEWKEANRFVLLPEQLINFVIPSWFGSPQNRDYWGSGNVWEPCVYVGLLPLALGIYALARGIHRRAVKFFAVLALLALWLSLGRFGGLFYLAYYTVPGIASFHDPARFNFVTTFVIAILAAAGLRQLRDERVANGWRLAVIGIAAVQLAWFAAGLNPTVEPGAFAHRPAIAEKMPVTDQGRAFYAFGPDMWKRYAAYQDYGPQTEGRVREIRNSLLPNVHMELGFEEGNSYEPVPIKAAWEANGIAFDAVERHDPALTDRMNLVNAWSLLLPGGMRYHHPGLQQSLRGASVGFENRDRAPRAWIVRDWSRVDGMQRSLNAVGVPAFKIAKGIVSGSLSARETERDGEANNQPPGAQVLNQRAGEAVIQADCESQSGLLVWSHTAYPGWRAQVDVAQDRALTVNSAFLGVGLRPGKHTVRFSFEPFTYRLGLYLTAVALAVIAGAVCVGSRARGFDRSGANLPV